MIDPRSLERLAEREEYRELIAAKDCLAESRGLPCDPAEVNPLLHPFQRDTVAWAVQGGNRALFKRFGLGKTFDQLEIMRLLLKKIEEPKYGRKALIVLPLGVRGEFFKDAAKLGLTVKFIRTNAEAVEPGIYLTNYESVRDGKLDPRLFDALSLDEAAILRGMGGTKTFRTLMGLFENCSSYRFVATATPSPNEFIEIAAYAAFLGIMDVGQIKTRFFKRNPEKNDDLTLLPHKEAEWWLWINSWALFVTKPSDINPEYSDEGYILPPLEIRWHKVATDHTNAGYDPKSGQGRLLKNSSLGVSEAAGEKRDSLSQRVAKMLEIRAEAPNEHRIIWHDREDERLAIEKAIPGIKTVHGSMKDLDERELIINDFSDGNIPELGAKPVMLGSGCNFQRYCSWAIYLGIGFKFHDFIQSIHRLRRYLQPNPVRVDLIYTEAEEGVKEDLERKWRQDDLMVEKMTALVREYGLTQGAMGNILRRSLGVKRKEVGAENWTLAYDDAYENAFGMKSDSVGLIVTSIPFSTQYEYTPSYNDFGHTDDNEHFWRQMDYLTREMFRVLEPGRDLCIHVKDRIVPGGLTGYGFETSSFFHMEAGFHYRKHGFAYLGMVTIDTDVVRENNQTNRLKWSEQCKDGTRMGFGMPEYVLCFRKPPSDSSDGYADNRVTKSKQDYTLARWQVDAHAHWRSNGNRLLSENDLKVLPHEKIYKLWKRICRNEPYDYERHVAIGQTLRDIDRLPTKFMLLPPHSNTPNVWSDVARMLTLNTYQAQKGVEQHLCPMPLDIVKRLIVQRSNKGDLVYDPFSGLGTVPYIAVLNGRRGYGSELSPIYFADSVRYLRSAQEKLDIPTLFDLAELEAEDCLEEVAI